jgi:choline dehydrogenase-like flavoprotein
LADRGIRPVVLDVGLEPEAAEPVRGNFYELRQRADVFDLMIGAELQRVRSLARSAPRVPAKLTAPRIGYVVRDAQRYGPLDQQDYAAVQSFASGGLANAWGAGLYRFTARELAGMPIGVADLAAYYDRLDREIGISGQPDDLTPYFGESGSLRPPLRLSRKAEWLLARYARRREKWNRQGVFLGRPRLGVVSEPGDDGRPACDYSNLEFWQPELAFIYNPALTLRRLVREGKVVYRQGLVARRWSRRDDALVVHAEDCRGQGPVSWPTRRLLLAAGAIGSAKLALQSRDDYTTTLSLLDNPALQFPMVLPRFLATPLETHCFGLTQLNLVYDAPGEPGPLQASILEITSPARSEFFSSLPLAARDNLTCIRYLVPAMLVMQLFLPAGPGQAASLRLRPEGVLEIHGPKREDRGALEKLFVRVLCKLGATTLRGLVVRPPAGHGLHYAGTLPMSAAPRGPYECDRECGLWGEPGVHVLDGAVLPRLPSKNYSFTVMANAMRVADHVASRIQETRTNPQSEARNPKQIQMQESR